MHPSHLASSLKEPKDQSIFLCFETFQWHFLQHLPPNPSGHQRYEGSVASDYREEDILALLGGNQHFLRVMDSFSLKG